MKRCEVTLAAEAGLHARPADAFVRAAQRFRSAITLRAGAQSANGKAIVDVLMLGASRGASVAIEADGDDEDEAIEALAAILTAPAPATAPATATATAPKAGRAWVIPTLERTLTPTSSMEQAIDHARSEIRQRQASVTETRAGDAAAIFAAHESLLNELAKRARAHEIAGLAKDASLRAAEDELAVALASAPDIRMRSRVDDIHEVATHVMSALTQATFTWPSPGPWVAVTRHLDAALVADAHAHGIVGFVTTALSPLAHAAILANALALPVLVVTDGEFRAIRDGDPVDFSSVPAPASATAVLFSLPFPSVFPHSPSSVPLWCMFSFPATAPALRANVASIDEAHAARTLGAAGIGLVRTELLFAAHRTAPTVDEQLVTYRALLLDFGKCLITFRLFDAGGDKPVAFLPGPPEPRGIARLRLHPAVLATQLAALSPLPPSHARILVPFVESPDDLDLGTTDLSVGAMIESAAGVRAAAAIAARAAFISIGTNDLTASLTGRTRDTISPDDVLLPVVRGAIAHIIAVAHAAAREVTICGEAAASPAAVAAFSALGVDALSVSPLRFADVARYLNRK